MRNPFLRKKTESVDYQIDLILAAMNKWSPYSTEYQELLGQLERLHKLKMEEAPKSKPVSRDTVLLVAGNLLGILIIVIYERENVMTSKGFTQILRTNKY